MTASPKLRLHVSGTSESWFEIDQAASVGRAPDCALRLDVAGVSRRHGRFEPRDGGWYYIDTGSQNGSLLNGVPAIPDAANRLQPGDTLTIVAIDIAVESIGDADGSSSVIDETLLAPYAEVQNDYAGTARVVSAGRAIDNELVLDDPYVSGRHLEAWIQDGDLYARDLDSRNGTFIGDRRFSEGIISPNTTLRLGRTALLPASELLLKLRVDTEQSLFIRTANDADYLLVGSELGRVVRGGRMILRDVDISVRRGQFVAIAGASGAGKSTLMRVLNGYTPPDKGAVLVATGAAATIGYVPQDDIINRELPLRDALVLSGRLRYPPDTDRSIIETRVDEVLAELGLIESSATVVGRLSGGQRKRASVALELLTKPKLLLLDEPTSGLDPASDRRLIRLLRALADTGIGILLITHTTANIAACDTVAFLAPGGFLVYWGAPDGAKRYFAIDNLEEAYEQLESESTPAEWRARFLQSPEYAQLQREVSRGSAQLQVQTLASAPAEPPRQWPLVRWQLLALSRRYARTLIADRRNLALLLLQVPAILVLARVIFAPDVLIRINRAISEADANRYAAAVHERSPVIGNAAPGMDLLFVLATTLVWLGTINAAREICKELPVWERERHVGVLPVPYVLSKFLVLGALCAVQTALLVGLLLLFWDVPGGGGAIAGILITGLLASFSGVAVGMSVSASVSTPDRAVAFVPILMIPQILFGGAVIPLATIGTAGAVISSFAGARWAFEALGRVTDRAAYLPAGNSYEVSVTGSVAVPIASLLILALFFGLLSIAIVAGWGSVWAFLRRTAARRPKAAAGMET